MMRTVTRRPFAMFVTRTMVPNGKVGWAATIACMSKRTPLAVILP